jgi:hypothetical protein
MVSPLLALLVPALLSTPSSGGSFVVGTFDAPAADSAAVKKAYGAEAYSNPASSRSLSAPDGALVLTTTLATDSDTGYSAKAGIQVPLHNLWAPVDLRRATAITFRIKGSGAYNAEVSLGSDLYRGLGEGAVQTAPVKVTTTWTKVRIVLAPMPAFSYKCFMAVDLCEDLQSDAPVIITDPTDPLYIDSARNVAMAVKYLQFAIDPSWKTDSTWSAPAAGATTLSVDDIVIEGITTPCGIAYGTNCPIYSGVSCTAGVPSMTFASNKSQTNAAGGPWFAYTDSDASGQAKGTSSLVLPEGWTQWHVDTALAAAKLVANLSRPATSLHGGFAGVGTGVPDGQAMNLTGLQGIGFALSTPDGSPLDAAKVAGVHFKVSKASVGDSATHEVVIPASQFAVSSADLCIDIDVLRMPGSMLGTPQYKAFTPEDVTKLSWEIRMEDQTGTVTSVPNQGFMVGPVTLYGFSQLPATGVGPRAAHAPSFAARYQDGTLALQGLDGYASLEVRTLSGARIATVAPAAVVKIRLDRGAYMLVARGAGKPALSRTLAVAR